MLDRTTQYENLEQPQKRGQATEAIIRAAFALRDIPVLIPTSDESYDLVVEVGGQFHRIRCETAYRRSENTVAFDAVGTRPRGNGYDREEYDGRAEYFAVYDPVNDNRYLNPASEIANGTMEIRFRDSTDGHRVGIDRAEAYLLDDRLDDLRHT